MQFGRGGHGHGAGRVPFGVAACQAQHGGHLAGGFGEVVAEYQHQQVKAAAAFGVALVADKTAPALVVGVAVAVFAAAARAGAMAAGVEIARVDTQRGMNFRPAAISGGFQVGQRVGGLILRFHGILPFR